MGKLDGKVALVTGSARGQGEAVVRLFASEGASVVIADVLDHLGEAVAHNLGPDALFLHLDVAEPGDWDRAMDAISDRFGRLDILVNNAGIQRMGLIESQPVDDYMEVIRVNQLGCWLGMRAAIPLLKAAGGGSIVNTSSVAGLTGGPATAAYTASKFAIRGMTKCAAIELGRSNIRANSLHPGGVNTPMWDVPGIDDPAQADFLWAHQPIPRIGEPDEVAKMALFIVADATYSTGAEFVMDGGQMAGGYSQLDRAADEMQDRDA